MKKIFTATLGTETNTFASIPTGHQLFEETCLFRKGSYGKNVPMFGAPLAVWRGRAEAKGWQVVESLCAFAMPAGRTVKKVYESFRDEIVADLKAALPVDGVFLSMHGAMVAEGYDDCESDILAHVRKAVGPDVPVGVELDLHCNIGEGTLRDATALVLFKEYPHVDVPERADDLFDVMEGAIEGRTRPVMAAWDCKMIGVFHTTRQPMRGFVDKLQAMEGKDGVLSLSVAHGFPWSDIKEMGSKVIAITDGDRPKAEKLARELGQEFFAMRDATQPPYVSLDAAMARVSSHNLPKPMVLADVSDNAGGGAASDSTFILKALLDKKVKDAAIGMFWDPGRGEARFRGRRGRRARHPAGRQARPAIRPADRRTRQGAEAREERLHRVRRRAQERGLDRRCGGAADRGRHGDRQQQAHPVPEPRLLHQARRRSLDQEDRGREVHAALPRRLRADRQRSGLCRSTRRPGARLVAAALHQGRQGAMAVRREPARMKALALAGVLLAATAVSALAQSPNGVRTLNPPGAIKVEGTWSLGARAGDFVFVAGMQGVDPATSKLVEGDEARIRQAFLNIKTIAQSEGATLQDCVRLTVYVSDLARIAPLVDKVQAELWGKPPYPPRTMFEAKRLFDNDIIEIDSVFYAPAKK